MFAWIWLICIVATLPISRQSNMYKNMGIALRGYNILKGNPTYNSPDLDFLNQIFLKTSHNSGLTVSHRTSCKKSTKQLSFTNYNSYLDHVTKESRHGTDLQIGTSVEVTADVTLLKKTGKLNAKTNIPPPFTRAWSDSTELSDMKDFFKDEQGMLTISGGRCIMYDVDIELYDPPPFTPAFKRAISRLHEVSSGSKKAKKDEFKQFIKEYGTHFQAKSMLGVEYIQRSKFSRQSRKEFHTDKLKSCNDVKGTKAFGIQFEEDSNKCTEKDLKKLEKRSNLMFYTSHYTKGSVLDNIKRWKPEEFTPVPLSFQLAPIVNLFTKRYIEEKKLNDTNNNQVSSTLIRKWFVPLYFDYCTTMGTCDTLEQEGTVCGINDNCPINTMCEDNGRVCRPVGGNCANDEHCPKSGEICLKNRCHKRQKDEIIDTDITGEGNDDDAEWGTWDTCPEGSWVNAYNIRIHDGADNSGLTFIKLYCSPITRHITSGKDDIDWGSFGQRQTCNGYAIGYKLQVCNWHVGATDMDLLCDNDTEKSAGDWDGSNGPCNWSAMSKCKIGYRICGVQTKFEPHGGDDSGINGVNIKCCPIDRYIVV